MNNSILHEHLAEKGALLADGATGTNLFEMGLISGDAPEFWNVEQPEKILNLHQGFADAGADILLTNTFGSNASRLKLHYATHRVKELSEAGAKLCRQIVDKKDNKRKVLVAGSIGPTGELFVPLGELTHEVAVSAFTDQIEGLVDGGADMLWIETMSATEEITAASEAASASGLPFVITASFDTAGKTMMGLSPTDLGNLVQDLPHPPDAFGSNCGVGATDLVLAILEITEQFPEAIVVAKANCGIPYFEGDKAVYSGTPTIMAKYTHLALNAGAKIIGGCCGTTGAHLIAMRNAMDGFSHGPKPTREEIEAILGKSKTVKGSSSNKTRRRRRK